MELVRILACFVVVCCHVYLNPVADGLVDNGRTFIACCAADGVAVFWMLSGFYMFSAFDYKKLCIRTAKKVLVPLLIVGFVSFYFGGWLFGGESIAESLSHTLEDYANILISFLSFDIAFPHMEITWYLYVYIFVVIISPVLYSFCMWLDEDEKREKAFIIITLVMFFMNDITGNEFLEFSLHSMRGAVPAAVEIVWGHFLYKHLQKTGLNVKHALIGLAAFAGINVLRALWQIFSWNRGDMRGEALYWHSFFGLLAASFFILAVYSIGQCITSERVNKAIGFLGGCTFDIYLVHGLVLLTLMARFNMDGYFQNVCRVAEGGFLCDVLYTLLMALCGFAGALVVTLIIKAVGGCCKKVTTRSRN